MSAKHERQGFAVRALARKCFRLGAAGRGRFGASARSGPGGGTPPGAPGTGALPRIGIGKVAMGAAGLGVWGALVLLFAIPLALTSSASWRHAVRYGALFWALWLLFVPVVAWLAFRFPIERKRLVRNVGVHLLACLLVVGSSRVAFRVAGGIAPAVDARMARLEPPVAFGVFLGMRGALDVLVYWALVGVCQAIGNFRRSEERERRAAELEARLASARLQALRMQINPHFLFNTLNSIAALVHADPRAADEMLGDLSGLLRRSLDTMEEQEIPLGRELEFVGTYLRIEQKRFGGRLRLEQSVPEDLMGALVPDLILQPLVENAVRHGIEPRRGPGSIAIEAKREGKLLHLVVRDDGRGWPSGEGGRPERRGIGLANIQARLEGLYGREQSFTFGRAEPQGFRVDIRLPFRVTPVNVPAGAARSSE